MDTRPNPSADQKVLDFSRFRWAHLPLAAGAFYVFFSLVGLAVVAIQRLTFQLNPDAGVESFFSRGPMLIYLGWLACVALCSLLLGTSMIKRWRPIKWATGTAVVVSLVALTPLYIRLSQEYHKAFSRASKGAFPGWFAKSFDLQMQVSNVLMPIVAFALPAAAILVSLILDEWRPTQAPHHTNRPPS